MIDKKTPQAEAYLIEIFKEKGLNEKHYPKLYAYYKHCFEELYEDEYKNWTKDDYEETGDSAHKGALEVTNMFVEAFLGEKAKGQGDEWALAVASYVEEGEDVYQIVYDEIKKTSPEMAKQELLIRSRSLGGDENFIKHYMLLFESGSGYSDSVENAKKYSEIYKDQIVKGKSEFYAHHYADLRVSTMGYTELYCEAYTATFQKALNENKSIDYAELYAEKLGTYIANHCSSFSNNDEFGDFDFFHEQILEEMREWESKFKNNNI